MEAVISKIYLTEIRCWSKPTFSMSKKGRKRYKKVQRPQNQFCWSKKREGGRADLKNAGVKKFSSFIWTLVVKKGNGKRKRDGVGCGRIRTYPTPSEFTQHLQNLSNTFRTYPTPSEFTQHLQDLPTPSEFTHHLQNLPTTFRIYPPLYNLPYRALYRALFWALFSLCGLPYFPFVGWGGGCPEPPKKTQPAQDCTAHVGAL